MAEIKLISECFVKPKYEVEAAKDPYHLSPIELVMLSMDPIQRGLLYALNNNTQLSTDFYDQTKTVSHLLEKLKHSLSLALIHFYPLGGRFATQKYHDEHACRIFVDCNKGPGARLIHASVLELTVSDILSPTYVPAIIRSFFELGEKSLNYDGHTKALLSIQVTQLQDGVFIGFTVNHSVVDGTSFIHFVSMLSEMFGSDEHLSDTTRPKISRVPIFNSTPWISNCNENVAVLKLPHLEPEEFLEYGHETGPLRERIFHFSAATLGNLKSKANQECGTDNVISSFQALSALVWRSINRARNVSSDQLVSCSVVMNVRSRFDPPLSDDCFGNFISGAPTICSVEELLGRGLGWTAMNLHKFIAAQDTKTVLDFYNGFVEAPKVLRPNEVAEIHGPNNVVIGGSARFNIYGPEFGLGRALATRMGFVNKHDGKVNANPGSEGGGSVDLEICLRPQFMAALETDSEFMSLVSL